MQTIQTWDASLYGEGARPVLGLLPMKHEARGGGKEEKEEKEGGRGAMLEKSVGDGSNRKHRCSRGQERGAHGGDGRGVDRDAPYQHFQGPLVVLPRRRVPPDQADHWVSLRRTSQ